MKFVFAASPQGGGSSGPSDASGGRDFLLHTANRKTASDLGSGEEVLVSARSLLPRLQRVLLDGTYQPGDIRRVWISKPGGGERGLGIPNVIDRWVQQAVLQVLEPIFEPTTSPVL